MTQSTVSIMVNSKLWHIHLIFSKLIVRKENETALSNDTKQKQNNFISSEQKNDFSISRMFITRPLLTALKTETA
jgi:hypothetical protein